MTVILEITCFGVYKHIVGVRLDYSSFPGLSGKLNITSVVQVVDSVTRHCEV